MTDEICLISAPSMTNENMHNLVLALEKAGGTTVPL